MHSKNSSLNANNNGASGAHPSGGNASTSGQHNKENLSLHEAYEHKYLSLGLNYQPHLLRKELEIGKQKRRRRGGEPQFTSDSTSFRI